MKTWIIALTFVASLAVAADAEAHWWPRHYGAYYGYTTYYVPAPVVYVPPPVVAYRPVVVAPVYVAPPVVAYQPYAYPAYPVAYSTYYRYGW
ncbi:MAG: hypothetical protein KDA86_19620 [Planctomycetaceae bacterium]|nr:hypothetical protein [Planctomycetaceae bacterium]